MAATDLIKDLSRTAAAIEAYDTFDATSNSKECDENPLKWIETLDQLGWEVGHAFGLDTADRNSLSTCEGCIRPGHKVPAPGSELSFVRKAVAEWQKRK